MNKKLRLLYTYSQQVGGGTKVYGRYKCYCGDLFSSRTYDIKKGNTTSCGCRRQETLLLRETHGMSKTREYSIWEGMKQRCLNPNHESYRLYGGRGIAICDRWLSFKKFYSDMGPANGLTLERIDNEKGYGPKNCKWASSYDQARNKRSNKIYEGKCLADWARESGIPKNTLKYRINAKGLSIQEAIAMPKGLQFLGGRPNCPRCKKRMTKSGGYFRCRKCKVCTRITS